MSTAVKQIKVESEYNGEKLTELDDRVLVAVGRVPNSADLGLENTQVELDEKGFVKINPHQQTDDPSIYAIGDIVGGILRAVALIVNGFAREVLRQLPMEFAVEAQKLLGISLEGSVG